MTAPTSDFLPPDGGKLKYVYNGIVKESSIHALGLPAYYRMAFQRLADEGGQDPQPIAETSGPTGASHEADDEPETLSHDEKNIMMGFVENICALAQKMMSGPLDIPVNDLRVRGLSAQADLSEARLRCRGTADDIERAVECRSQALLLTPDGHAKRTHQLISLGISLSHKFERLANLTDINRAIHYLRQAMQITPEGHPDYVGVLSSLGAAYLSRYERLGELADLDQAIRYLTSALRFNPDDHPNELESGTLSYLGASYIRRFERLGELADLDQAIQSNTQAVQLTPNGHPDKPRRLHNLGGSYKSRFERLGELADLNQAIQFQTQAVQLTPHGHPHKPEALNSLGTSYRSRFRGLGEVEDLNQAVQYLIQAVQLIPDDHPNKPATLSNLGSAYLVRFARLGELADLDLSIECQTQGLRLAPDGHPDETMLLTSLELSYQGRFDRFGEISDLNQAIRCQSKAVQTTPDDHPSKQSTLNNLGISYLGRFERLGELTDVDQAIQCLNKSLRLTPDGHPEKSATLNSLGAAFHCRFNRLQELADLNRSIQCNSQAVQLTPDFHAQKAPRLGQLGDSYWSRFQHLGKLADLDRAIQCQTQAEQLTPDGHPGKATMLNNLGSSYQGRFNRLNEQADLDQAIQCMTQALKLTSDEHPDKPIRLNNLGWLYLDQFERLGELADVNQAVCCLSQAVQLTPDGHAGKPFMLIRLGRSYSSRFKANRQLVDQESALSAFQQAAQLPLTDPETQLRSARSWAQSCLALGLSPLHAYDRSFAMIPQLVSLGATIDRRYSLLTSVSDLAAEAASWAISVESYDLAIEWLEQGRSIVWNQILQLRTPLDELSAHAPGLARRLKDIASQLERAGSRQPIPDYPSDTEPDLEEAAQHHRRLAAEWKECIEEARNLPGFANLLRPRKAAELKTAATDGPVVLINHHFTRWDALVIFPRCDEVAHISLVKWPPNQVGQFHARGLLDYLAEHRGQRGRGFVRKQDASKPGDPFKAWLGALWKTVVEPVLNALACTNKLPVEELPHVTWCPTGPLAFAPLHAAGLYDGLSHNAYDLVISSYTPSLSALLPSGTLTTQPDIGILAIGQEYSKGLCQLPYTHQELEAIKMHVPATQFLQLDGRNATVQAVLDAMDKHSWVHLACHATQDLVNPTHCAFHLHNGNLTLEAITSRQFKNKGLAFLSACQTAKGDGKMPDEAVHLAAGMLMAGYPSVIATMWSIHDIDGPEVAGRVYAELLKDGKMDHRESARALHNAVAELRDKIGVNSFKRWVPFVHIGV